MALSVAISKGCDTAVSPFGCSSASMLLAVLNLPVNPIRVNVDR